MSDPTVTEARKTVAGSASSGITGLIIRYGEAYTLVGLMLVIAAVFSVLPATSETFPTAANLRIVIANQTVLAIVALAAFIPLITNEFDVSVGANLGLASILAASAMSIGVPWPVALCIAAGVGACVGVVNGLLITWAGINSLITTLGTSIIIHGIVVWKTNGVSIVSNIPPALTRFGSGAVFGVPLPLFALLAVTIAIAYLAYHTPFGRYMYAIGSNASAARLVGINTKRILFRSFVLAGLLAGLAGFLQVSRTGGANPRVGEAFTLPALAAAFLSAASIRPGTYNVVGVIVAVFFLATLNSGLNLAGADVYVNDLINGCALILGVGLARFLGRNQG
ncbi:ABC transporter permease [Mesorhizobium sp.]|uniref:ABC transporter permease n=1 Tax=Mesorhizobium sp. TaxID=1871066 RepID=UPI000FE3A304|nr:ABC transporter permease [Mesorhizobium sp.]RWA61151.1 MAG: ABC transporter permease [Mesorhizobium sp.]RWB94025.1 MAG: ABC transporter permease [Mesorhizobium sp.]RWG81111.1 MAG: ABC transporter permease [Mesorhizobium sp.]RWK15198.1 MAG: ABC transporter permease [Mesorhizobium sp.]